MSSPVDINFESFIKIDRKKTEAVYMQIVYQFINAVNSKILEEGDLLPGSRKISEALHVHRKTVIAALTELQEQGWIETAPSVGTYVKNPKANRSHLSISGLAHPPLQAPYRYRKELVLDMPMSESPRKYSFSDGTVDDDLINISELVRFYSAVLKRKKRSDSSVDLMGGNTFFRDQLSFYLNLTRGFHLSRNFLLPISSREKIFSILSRLLIETGDIILIGELSNFLPNMIFSQAGANLKTVPIDDQGMDVDFIETHFSHGDIRCVYVNSLCHYPTTARLSDRRKDKLLSLAEKYEFIIIEDDEDFEFSTIKEKTESLFRKDRGKRVIYMGAFGKFLNSSFQMNFLTAPTEILNEGKKYLNVFGKTDFMLEEALGDIIQQGDIFRYQRKSQKTISARKKAFSHLLHVYFKDRISFTVPESGLAFWILFKDNLPLVQFQKRAIENGLLIPRICLYQNRSITAIRLGFAHLDQPDMEEIVILLHKTYMEIDHRKIEFR